MMKTLNDQVLQACMYNSMPRDLVEVSSRSSHKEKKKSVLLLFLSLSLCRVHLQELRSGKTSLKFSSSMLAFLGCQRLDGC